jgi:hypothetical protein
MKRMDSDDPNERTNDPAMEVVLNFEIMTSLFIKS